MSARNIQIGDHTYAVALTWHTISDKNEIPSLLEARETEYGILIEDQESNPRMAGLIVTGEDGAAPKSFAGEDSAAACLAGAASESILVIEQLDENIYWLCAVEAGLVLMGTDIVLDEDEARRHIDDLLALSLFAVKGTGSEKFGGDGESFTNITTGGTGDVDPEIVKLSPFPLKEVLIVTGGGVFLVCLLLTIYIKLIHPWIFPPEVEVSQSEREELERRKAKARQEVAKALQRDLSQPSVQEFWHEVYKGMKEIKALDVKGWRVSTITCQISSCQFQWNNTFSMSQSAIEDITEDICTPNYEPQGTAAQCGINFTIEPRDTFNLDNEDYVDAYQLREQFLAFKRSQIRPTISPASLYKGIPDSHLLEDHELYLRGKWTMRGELILMEETSDLLSRDILRTLWPETLSMRCSRTGSCSFEMGGSYVGKK